MKDVLKRHVLLKISFAFEHADITVWGGERRTEHLRFISWKAYLNTITQEAAAVK